ncbi:MAG: hypothetical protein EPN47_04750 [Acidobacteria bacterium]|nr:MAG: hypothetical protein EPN47_04750 [Acidobacteriota bacterium]
MPVGFEPALRKAATAHVRKEAAAAGGGFDLVVVDLANLASVPACAEELLKKGDSFDVIIANTGVMVTPLSHTLVNLTRSGLEAHG